MPRSPAADALTNLVLEIFRVNGDLLAAGDRLVGDLEQTSARWQVLGAVQGPDDTVSGIARTMGLSRQSVQRTVDILADAGLVAYADNPAHRRAKLVRLTPDGETLLAEIAPRQSAWVQGLVDALGLTEKQIRSTHRLLRGLRTELEATAVTPSPSGRSPSRR